MDYGTEAFCAYKKINAVKTVKSYTKETGLQVQDNFSKFASWVDRKIKSGDIKGDDTPIHGQMWKEHKEEQRRYNEEMASFNPSQRAFGRQCKNVSLDRFLHLNDVQKPRRDGAYPDALSKLGKSMYLYDFLVESELLDKFLNYTESVKSR